MDNSVKIIANYLPQFHAIPENDAWWGKGYTDWKATKAAKPIFEGQRQPRVPLNNNYYSLDRLKDIQWQVDLANRYGVYGFGIYHYWFSSDMCLLDTPPKIIRDTPSMGIHYMFIWDNCSWKRTWSGLEGNDWAPQFDDTKEHPASESGILAELRYGDKSEWEKHFYYLLPFFKDSRYITWNGEPIFAVMLPGNNFSLLEKMFSYWNELAKDNNLPGVKCLSLDTFSNRMKGHLFQSSFRYAPFQQYSLGAYLTERRKRKKAKREELTRFYEYSQLWEYILKQAKRSESNTILSGFVTYDDTPRRGKMAQIVRDATPLQFERYLTELLFISQQQKKPYLFLSAWNEWGEGMYLEPDTEYKYEWLEAVRNALIKVNGDI